MRLIPVALLPLLTVRSGRTIRCLQCDVAGSTSTVFSHVMTTAFDAFEDLGSWGTAYDGEFVNPGVAKVILVFKDGVLGHVSLVVEHFVKADVGSESAEYQLKCRLWF